LKLGMDYQDRSTDSVARLLACAGRALLGEPLPARLKIAHLAWFVALGLAPRPLAARMLWLRFNRATVKASGRRLLGRLEERMVRSRVNVG
jgi:hypothetical protein